MFAPLGENRQIQGIRTVTEAAVRKTLHVAGIVFLLTFTLIPLFWMVLISLNERPDFMQYATGGMSLKNYIEVISSVNLHFLDYLRNSVIVAGATALMSAVIGASAAFAVSRIAFPGKIILVIVVLGLSMFPQICIIGYLYKFMANLSLINTYSGLILPYVAWSLPLALWLLMSYFGQIPRELDNAARVDGANRAQILTKIIMPLALPGFFSTVLLLFMFAFNEFLFALMLTTNYKARTVSVGIALFQGMHGELPWGYIMAASVLSSIPVIVIALALQKYIIQGLTQGAVKS